MLQDLSVMIIGGGAREHTLSWMYEKSPQVKKIVVAPGNDFITYGRQKEVIVDGNCSINDPLSILALAKKYKPTFVDVAQDDALAKGTVDLLQQEGFLAFGPTQKAARIEWDKKWSREFMDRHQIPQPTFKYYTDEVPAIDYVKQQYDQKSIQTIYVKAAGLAAGKGALKSTNLQQAIENIKKMKTFPNGAGNIFLLEEGLVGEEFSYYALSDGTSYKLFNSAQDNKTIWNFDEGDQTGGMGANSPALVTFSFSSTIEKHFIEKVVSGMSSEGNTYKGILFFGGIIVDGKPINIEYNARWGDPECQAVLPSLKTDYVDLVFATFEKKLHELELVQDKKTRVCVVGASKGYPNDYSVVKGKRIFGLEEVMLLEDVHLFGAGITTSNGKFYANGGRLFSVVGEGKDVLEAKQKAYSAISRISIEGNNLHYRTDIGWRDAERLLKTI